VDDERQWRLVFIIQAKRRNLFEDAEKTSVKKSEFTQEELGSSSK